MSGMKTRTEGLSSTKPSPSKAQSMRVAPTRSDPVRKLARRIVDVTVGNDIEAALSLYADGVESIEPGAAPTVGIGAVRRKFTTWRESIGEATWRPLLVCTEGNTILIEWAARITFTTTGRPLDFREVAVHEVENGKIVRERFYYDRALLSP
jgi:ketosteroid isomerase-like protein